MSAAPPPDGVISTAPAAPGEPMLRWASRSRTIDGIQAELNRIWSSISLTAPGEGGTEERRVAARSSVMNLVVIAGRGEVGERAAAIVDGLTGRHPSRTLIVSQADPDGPAWLDAQIQAHCMLPSASAPETCSELVYLTAGGGSGQHLAGSVAPLLIHDLPVCVWWPGEPHFEFQQTRELLALADRILVDGSAWAGDGLARLATMARLAARFDLEVADFALLRQARWREAIASTFDRPTLLPFLSGLTDIHIRYAAHDGAAGDANVVKPLYHAAWLASRLGMVVEAPLHAGPEAWAGFDAALRHGRRRLPIALRPVESAAPAGTTLAVEITARRRRSELRLEVTAFPDGVGVRATVDGAAMPERRFLAPRRREGDLLAETIESAGRDRISVAALRMAAALVGDDVGDDRPNAGA
jgi:glucose-6-phosphate dehydrogenase assembly protein OpcA